MAWIAILDTTPNKPEVLILTRLLGVTRDEVLGKLVCLWLWVDSQGSASTVTRYAPVTDDSVTVSGDLGSIDALTGHNGFGAALQTVGWLHVGEGILEFPHYLRHKAQTLKDRLLAQNRMRKMRTKNQSVTRYGDVTPNPVTKASRNSPTTTTTTTYKEIASAISADTTKESASATTRKRNPVWDAVVALWFGDGVSETQKTRVGKLTRDFAAKADFSPDELRKRRDRIAAAWGAEKATPETVEKHWGEFAQEPKVSGRQCAAPENEYGDAHRARKLAQGRLSVDDAERARLQAHPAYAAALLRAGNQAKS